MILPFPFPDTTPCSDKGERNTKSCVKTKNSACKALFLFQKSAIIVTLWNKKDEIIQKVSLAFCGGTPYNSGEKWILSGAKWGAHRDRRI